MTRSFDVAVVGADQPVGQALMEMLRAGGFPLGRLHELAEEEGGGDSEDTALDAVADFDFADAQIAFFAASASTSEAHALRAADAGCVVIDHSGAFNADPDVPLVLPGINTAALAEYRERMLIACPGAATVQLLTALQPLHDEVGLERINVTLLEPVSSRGQKAVRELAHQAAQLLNAQAITPRHHARQIAFNILPDSHAVDAAGSSGAERALSREVVRLLGDAAPAINATLAQVPVFFGAVQVLHIETRNAITAEEAWNLLSTQPGVKVLDTAQGDAANPVEIAAGTGEEVCISRIREDSSHPRGLDLWVVADNVRRVAAATGIRIAQALATEYM